MPQNIMASRCVLGKKRCMRRILPVDIGTLAHVYERIPGDFCSPVARRHYPFHIVVSPRTPSPIQFAELGLERVSCGG